MLCFKKNINRTKVLTLIKKSKIAQYEGANCGNKQRNYTQSQFTQKIFLIIDCREKPEQKKRTLRLRR